MFCFNNKINFVNVIILDNLFIIVGKCGIFKELLFVLKKWMLIAVFCFGENFISIAFNLFLG